MNKFDRMKMRFYSWKMVQTLKNVQYALKSADIIRDKIMQIKMRNCIVPEVKCSGCKTSYYIEQVDVFVNKKGDPMFVCPGCNKKNNINIEEVKKQMWL